MDIKEKFGKQIKKERTKIGLSQEAFALLCDLDRTYIASIENGKRNVSLLNIEKICTALNYSLSDFFKQMEVQ
ncbi:MAG: helix-turn-helix transcriptional regulator [Clostridia bacterium]